MDHDGSRPGLSKESFWKFTLPGSYLGGFDALDLGMIWTRHRILTKRMNDEVGLDEPSAIRFGDWRICMNLRRHDATS